MQMILKKAFIGLIALTSTINSGAQVSRAAGLLQISTPTPLSPQVPFSVEMPQILPASPEASAFVKAGVGNANMSTGAATANIPLYTIKLRDYTFPISLSYSTQGLKVDEACSRVGYGWVLNATGMITRSVKGKPDEFAQRLAIPANFTTNTDATYNFDMDATSSSGGDTQPDEFQFNVNGYTGKFVLGAGYIPRCTSTTNVKIDVNISVTPGSTSGYIGLINLTTPDGVKYQFGTNYEITTDMSIIKFSPYKLITKTAFFLDKITLPTGEFITFIYSPISMRVSTGNTQTLQIAHLITNATCDDCTSKNSYTTQEDRVSYNTKYLSGITTSDGQVINLGYLPRPDLSYDNRLASLEVVGLKKYLFEYMYIAGSNLQVTGRFFLTKLRDMKLGNITSTDSSYDHIFTYDQSSSIPLPLNFKQDFLGYYNGSNSNCFVPPALNSNNTIDFSFRNSSDLSRVGTLTKIQYPTGGKEEFIYEGNTTTTLRLRNTMTTVDLMGNGGGSAGSSYPITYTSSTFTVPRNQTVTLTAYTANAILNDGYVADPAHHSASIWLYDGATLLTSRSVLGYGPDVTTYPLLVGHTYTMQLKVETYELRGYFSILYNNSAVDIYDVSNPAIPGMRIRQIKSTDPISGTAHSKYFTYAALQSLDKSTGNVIGGIFYQSNVVNKTFCSSFGSEESDCSIDIWSSSSTNLAYDYSSNGSLIYYKTVIESDDPAFANGGTEYTYFDNDMGGNQQLLAGPGVPYLPMGQYPTLTGVLLQTRVFDNNLNIVQDEVNQYETLIYMEDATPSIYVRKKYEPYPTRDDRLDAFDVIKTTYANYWYRLLSKTSHTYANATTRTQQSNYTYGTVANILPATVTTTDSKGIQLKMEYKYPTDAAPASPDPLYNGAGYVSLTTKNIITPVVQENSYRNGVLLQQKRTMYRDWFSNVVAPEFVQLSQSPGDNIHNAMVFTKYDNTGNPQQLQKVLDIPITYLWDNTHALPICEVKNATFDQVACATFEAGTQYGNWTLSSGAINTTGVFSGLNGFTGTLTKTITITGTYTVTLWTNSTATVNGAAGTIVKTAQGKNLYSWSLLNPTTVTVTGTNIDDVRLFPKGSFMTSYTYIPFVGVSSVTDPNGNIIYDEYDWASRLTLVKDQDKKILKRICYAYTGHQDGCAVPTFSSAATSITLARNNCTGSVGTSVTYALPLGAYTSLVSQPDADQQAANDLAANGQNYANTNGACITPIALTSHNWVTTAGFTAVYTNVATGVQTSFTVPATAGVVALGNITAGTYNISISKPGNTTQFIFSVCQTGIVTSTSATFNNIVVSSTSCTAIQIDSPL